MRFPSIINVSKALRDLSNALPEGNHEVTLRVIETNQWTVAPGRTEGGPGYVGFGSIPGAGKRFASQVLARAMISEARSDHDNTAALQKEMRATLRAAASARRPRKKTGPFDIGEMVTAADGQVTGRVVGHGTIYTQLGPVHVHMIELAQPLVVPGFAIPINIVPLADAMLRLAGSFTAHADEMTPVMSEQDSDAVTEAPAARPLPVPAPRPLSQTTPPPRPRRARGTTANKAPGSAKPTTRH